MAREGRGPAYPLYERVMQELHGRDWTQVQLAEASGVARSTIDGWQDSARPPTAKTVRAVADILGIDRVEALQLAGFSAERVSREAAIDPLPATQAAPTLAKAVSNLREEAAREGRSLGELLVVHGLALPEELVVPDALPRDPIIAEIESSDISDETKREVIRLYLESRADIFEEERLRRKEERPDA